VEPRRRLLAGGCGAGLRFPLQDAYPDAITDPARTEAAERRKLMPERYEYRVVEVRESRIGGKMSGGTLAKLLNDHCFPGLAAQGDHQRGCEGPC
jgi:hypothetical protein